MYITPIQLDWTCDDVLKWCENEGFEDEGRILKGNNTVDCHSKT